MNLEFFSREAKGCGGVFTTSSSTGFECFSKASANPLTRSVLGVTSEKDLHRFRLTVLLIFRETRIPNIFHYCHN